LNPLNSNEDSASFLNFNLLQFNDMEKDLAGLDKFEGFSPRWLLPTKLRNGNNTELNTTVILLIIGKIIWYNGSRFEEGKRYWTGETFLIEDNRL